MKKRLVQDDNKGKRSVLAIVFYGLAGFCFFGAFILLVGAYELSSVVFYVVLGIVFLLLGKRRAKSLELKKKADGSDVRYNNNSETIMSPAAPTVPRKVESELPPPTPSSRVQGEIVGASPFSVVTAQTVEINSPYIMPDRVELDMPKVALLKYSYDDVFVAGTNHLDIDWSTLDTSTVDLVGEPSNQFDPRAVAVFYHDMKIGYLKRGKLQEMVNDYMASNDGLVIGRIVYASESEKKIFINLGFYKLSTLNAIKTIRFALIKMSKKRSLRHSKVRKCATYFGRGSCFFRIGRRWLNCRD